MSLQAPTVVVADQRNNMLATALRANDRAPVVECTWLQAADIIQKSWPSAVIFDDPVTEPRAEFAPAISEALALRPEPYLPILSRVAPGFAPVTSNAIPISAGATGDRIAARLASAIRVRTLHSTVFRRGETARAGGAEIPPLPAGDPLDDATVLVTGRGRTYPELATIVGERVGLIGSLSVESAARYLNSRDLNGIFIGEGYSPPMVDALLTALGEDPRFRDLPIALLGGATVSADLKPLPNFERFDARPIETVQWMWPLIRLHAFEARLQRQLTAIESQGMVDPASGLFTIPTFLRELGRIIDETRVRRTSLSVARLTFTDGSDRRVDLDAARQTSRLIRSVDFACQASDGSILLACPGTDLRSGHVVARRIVGALKSTILTSDRNSGRVEPMLELAAHKPTDTLETLLLRVSEPAQLAAE
jgi:hypothetical protein